MDRLNRGTFAQLVAGVGIATVACGPADADSGSADALGSSGDVSAATDTGPGGTGSMTPPAETSSTATAETSSTATAESTSGGAADSTGAPLACDGETCAADQYCDWVKASCDGDADGLPDQGACVDLPMGCLGDYVPVCGCDGEVYSNECTAASQGVDTDATGACTPPSNMFPCGDGYCMAGETYCLNQFVDITVSPNEYSCVALPKACADEPTCECVEAAGTDCAVRVCEEAGGDITVRC